MENKTNRELVGVIDGTPYYKCRNNECNNVTRDRLYCCIKCFAAHEDMYKMGKHNTDCVIEQSRYSKLLGVP